MAEQRKDLGGKKNEPPRELSSTTIDQHIHKESKKRRKNVAIGWIDIRKPYDMVPQSWIIHCLKI